MATLEELCALALNYHRAGDLGRARLLYHEVLKVNPNHPDVHHLLGVMAYQSGDFQSATVSIHRAIAINPSAAAYHNNLGLVQDALGQTDAALASFRQALHLFPGFPQAHFNAANVLLRVRKQSEAIAQFREALRCQPDYADAHCNLAMALIAQGELEEAVFHCHEALSLSPNDALVHNNLGNAYQKLGNTAEALSHWREALRIEPTFAEPYNNIGTALRGQNKLDEAVVSLREAIRLNPQYVEAYSNLGDVLRQQKKPDLAFACFKTALRLQPDYAVAYNNLGALLVSENKPAKAISCFRRASQLQPDFAEPYNNLGNVHFRFRQFDDAQAMYEKALSKDPQYAMAHFNLGTLKLLQGDWAAGWPEYEWRLKIKGMMPKPYQQPRWDGAPLAGRTLLIAAEQGFGDSIHFMRYAPLLQRQGNVIVECLPALRTLFANCSAVAKPIAQGDDVPLFDVYAPLMSLPAIMGTTLANVPADIPYLQADPKLVDHWRRELTPLKGFRVGIAWQGNPAYAFGGDRHRSIPLSFFRCLADAEGVHLISLQKGFGAEQLRDISVQFSVLDLGSRVDEQGAFMDTAAIMMNLDLVITSDTAIAHLAGALGVPVWVALQFVPEWRWLLDREDSPWYPTMRLFRQTSDGQWRDVFQRMTQEVERKK